MTEKQIADFCKGFFFGTWRTDATLIETHISWVILSGDDAFKIKKPLDLGFLNFTELEDRKHYCEREFTLNAAMSPIYYGTLPVVQQDDGAWHMDGKGKPMDYAVHMRRMDVDQRMDKVLKRHKLPEGFMENLGQRLANIHHRAQVVQHDFNADQQIQDFNDLAQQRHWIAKSLGAEYAELLDATLEKAAAFVQHNAPAFQERVDNDLVRDVHGDLHTQNIFVDEPPILFDCIEFNDAFRQIDVLNEVAFLSMDLEWLGYPKLAEAFLAAYDEAFPAFQHETDQKLFAYFKAYRANVRAKIGCLHAQNAEDTPELRKGIKRYLEMMDGYLG